MSNKNQSISKSSPELVQPFNSILEVGKATPEQITEWKKQYGEGQIQVLKVKISENETALAYLKPVGRDVAAKAMSLYAEKQIIQTGEFIINNCWLGGDDRIKTNEKVSMAAAVQANALVEFLETSVEKL